MLSVGAIAILFPHSCIDYVDIDCNWRWFVILRSAASSLRNFRPPAAGAQFQSAADAGRTRYQPAEPFHHRLVHALAADSGYLNAILPKLHTGIGKRSIRRQLTRISEVWLADAITITARAFRVRCAGVVVTVTTNIYGLATFTLKR